MGSRSLGIMFRQPRLEALEFIDHILALESILKPEVIIIGRGFVTNLDSEQISHTTFYGSVSFPFLARRNASAICSAEANIFSYSDPQISARWLE